MSCIEKDKNKSGHVIPERQESIRELKEGRKEPYPDQERKVFEFQCMQYGVDPDSSTAVQEVEEKHRQIRLNELCVFFQVNPQEQDIERKIQAAIWQASFESACKFFGIDNSLPQNEREKRLRAAQDSIKLEGRRIALKEDLTLLSIDPKNASEKDLEKAAQQAVFRAECRVYGIDWRSSSQEDLHKAKCHFHSLSETASEEELETKIERDNWEFWCQQWGKPLAQSREEFARIATVMWRIA